MKLKPKSVMIFMLLLLMLPLAYAGGEDTYLEATKLLSEGQAGQAQEKFLQASGELSEGAAKENSVFMVDFLVKLTSKSTAPRIIKEEYWNFIGEVKDNTGVHHLYYGKDSSSVFHSQIKEGATPDELVSLLGTGWTKMKVTSDAEGYLSKSTNIGGNTETRARIWQCGDTTHITYETFSVGQDAKLDTLFSEKVRCVGREWLWVVLAVVGVTIAIALLFWKRVWLKNMIKASRKEERVVEKAIVREKKILTGNWKKWLLIIGGVILVILLILGLFFMGTSLSPVQKPAGMDVYTLKENQILYFYHDNCGYCMEASSHLNYLVGIYGDKIQIIKVDLGKQFNQNMTLANFYFNKYVGQDLSGVPFIVVNDNYVSGWNEEKRKELESYLKLG